MFKISVLLALPLLISHSNSSNQLKFLLKTKVKTKRPLNHLMALLTATELRLIKLSSISSLTHSTPLIQKSLTLGRTS